MQNCTRSRNPPDSLFRTLVLLFGILPLIAFFQVPFIGGTPSTDQQTRMDFELLAAYHTDHPAIHDIVVKQPLLFLLDLYDGLSIINVSDPSEPTTLGTFAPKGPSLHIKLFDDIVYIFDNIYGISIVNLTDLAHPSLISTYDSATSVRGVCVHEDLLIYSSQYDGLHFLNISDLCHPVEITSLPDFPDSSFSLHIQNNLLYVASRSEVFFVYNISTISTPVLLAQNEYDGISSFRDMRFRENLAYLSCWTKGVHIFNFSDPISPTELSQISNTSESSCISLANDFLFIADGAEGLKVADIHDSLSPRIIGGYDMDGPVRYVDVFSNYVFLGNEVKGLYILKYTVHSIDPSLEENPSLPGWPWGYFIGFSFATIGFVVVVKRQHFLVKS